MNPSLKRSFFICLAMLGIHTIANTFSLNLSFVIAESRIGDASITGTIIAFTSLGGLLTGLLYQRILDLARRFVVAIAIFLLAAGLFIASLSYSIALMIVAAFFRRLWIGAHCRRLSDQDFRSCQRPIQNCRHGIFCWRRSASAFLSPRSTPC
jgi:MFS family permease